MYHRTKKESSKNCVIWNSRYKLNISPKTDAKDRVLSLKNALHAHFLWYLLRKELYVESEDLYNTVRMLQV